MQQRREKAQLDREFYEYGDIYIRPELADSQYMMLEEVDKDGNPQDEDGNYVEDPNDRHNTLKRKA